VSLLIQHLVSSLWEVAKRRYIGQRGAVHIIPTAVVHDISPALFSILVSTSFVLVEADANGRSPDKRYPSESTWHCSTPPTNRSRTRPRRRHSRRGRNSSDF
jgi:hypothetical protein